MTAATTAIETYTSGEHHVTSADMGSAQTIYEGWLVNLNSTSYAVSATDSATDLKCVGTAHETVDNSAGADGAKQIMVRWGSLEDYVLTHAVANQEYAVYVLDNQTVGLAAAATNDIPVGLCKGEGITGSTHSRIHVIPQSVRL